MPAKQSKSLKEETILSLDYGEANIGLAFGKNGFVMPGEVLSGKNEGTAIYDITRYIYENKVERVIIGLPLNLSGKETTQSRKVHRFAKLLKIKSKKPITFVNEYHTSMDSKTEAINLGISKKRRQKVDHLSAALILKEYYSKLD